MPGNRPAKLFSFQAASTPAAQRRSLNTSQSSGVARAGWTSAFPGRGPQHPGTSLRWPASNAATEDCGQLRRRRVVTRRHWDPRTQLSRTWRVIEGDGIHVPNSPKRHLGAKAMAVTVGVLTWTSAPPPHRGDRRVPLTPIGQRAFRVQYLSAPLLRDAVPLAGCRHQRRPLADGRSRQG